KTRASASFTAELKDFVAPTDLFLAARVELDTQTPFVCDQNSISNIYINNPVSTSTYIWSTPNGRIVGSTTGNSINVDTAGTYIVTQYLQAGCSPYGTDTVAIASFGSCFVLANNLIDFKASLDKQVARLSWQVLLNEAIKYFDVERSFDGISFSSIARIGTQQSNSEITNYSYEDLLGKVPFRTIYYRIRIKDISNQIKFSEIAKVAVNTSTRNSITIIPNPVKDVVQLFVTSKTNSQAQVRIYDQMGKIIRMINVTVEIGNNVITLNDLANHPRGIYQVMVMVGSELYTQKLLLIR
ncbi:MAG: T9SS type A sorting domain-containing protein, partial [Bacteroidia bacterium]|nr:T9SS type A sorting domain-containing protein [Bacteroidia bacterium]